MGGTKPTNTRLIGLTRLAVSLIFVPPSSIDWLLAVPLPFLTCNLCLISCQLLPPPTKTVCNLN
jgi:hypothetical protein